MTQLNNSPYQSPTADLINHDSKSTKIQEFDRFSAWAVFFLSLITLGIYQIYWLYSRATVINAIHEKKIHKAWLIILIFTTLLSFATSFIGVSDAAIVASAIITLVYIISYLVVLFTARNRLQDIMNTGRADAYKVSAALTFFGSIIYLQYKINQCIDENIN